MSEETRPLTKREAELLAPFFAEYDEAKEHAQRAHAQFQGAQNRMLAALSLIMDTEGWGFDPARRVFHKASDGQP